MQRGKIAKKRVTLSPQQIEIVSQFNDYAFENSQLSFDEAVQKKFGSNFFPNTPNGRKFRAECKAIFDAERKP
jgi:hypothetical protein